MWCVCFRKDGEARGVFSLDTDEHCVTVSCLTHTPHTSHITHHTSHLTPHTSHLTTHTSHLTPHTSHLTPHTSHITPHTSHLTHHTSHITPHTSHLTPHTSRFTLSHLPSHSTCKISPHAALPTSCLAAVSCRRALSWFSEFTYFL